MCALYDLGVVGGTLVEATGRSRTNLYVRDGVISAHSAELLPSKSVVDAGGCFVLPGMVDAHVHAMDPGDLSREDFPSATRAAAKHGVTTIVEHTHGWPVRTPADLKQKVDYLQGRSYVDFGLGAHVWPGYGQDYRALWNAGVNMFKVFTCTTHGVPACTGAALREAFEAIAEFDGIVLVHAEDEAMTAQDEERLKREGRMEPDLIPEWRSALAEEVAVAYSVLTAVKTGVRLAVAHASSPSAVMLVRRLRGTARIFVESCPQYFHLMRDEIKHEGSLRKFTPPARAVSETELDCMWRLLREGQVDYLASDHAPSTLKQKQAGSIWDAPFGLPGLDTTLPLMLSAALSGRITLERLVQLYSRAPAEIYGLYPRKGHCKVGADADLVIVDPDATTVVSNQNVFSKAGWTPFAGSTLQGRIVGTYLRGNSLMYGQTSEVRGGRFIPGPGAT